MITPYEKSRIVKPRAFYVRLVTSVVPMLGTYALFAYNYMKAIRSFTMSHAAAFVFTLGYTLVFAGVSVGLAVAFKRWCWDTVYVIVGTLTLQGRPGVVIPLGTRFQSARGGVTPPGHQERAHDVPTEQEFITVREYVIGNSGRVDCEIAVKWSGK